LDDQERKVAAKCRTCGEHLTVAEFRACSGVGHYCKAHLPSGSATRQKSAAPPKRRPPRMSGGAKGPRVTPSGAAEYPCKAQFAGTGVIRRGVLTSDHPSCLPGDVVFVHKKIGYGPGEIVTLFIKDARGRALAERTGYTCDD